MGDQTIERIPMDLAPTPVLKVEPPRNSPGAALLRTVPISAQQSRYLTTSIQSSTSSVSTPSPALAKQGVSGAGNMGPAVINRLTTMPVAGTTSSYHVPRGAAAVANIAVPRSSLATPIIRGSSTLQTIGVPTSSSQPGFIRAVSPAGARGATSWVGVSTTQATANVRPPNNSFAQNRMTVSTRLGPGTTVSTRPVLLQATPSHKQLSITQTPNQVQIVEKKVVTKGPGVAPGAVRGVSQNQGVRLSGGSVGPRLAQPLRPVVSLHPTAVLVSSPTPPPTIQIQSPTRPGTVSVLTSAVRVTSAPPGSGVQGSKVYCQAPEPSVYIQATHKPAQGANVVSIPNSLYSLPANSYYDSPANVRTFTTAPASTTMAVQQPRPTLTQVQGLVSTVPVRLFNPRMVVDPSVHPYVPSESAQTISTSENCSNASNQPQPQSQSQSQPHHTVHKQNASPRPSILRKRDTEGTPGKAAKNLNPLFGSLSVATPSSPPRPESRGAGGAQSSGGSTTISATSSPGLDTTSVSPPLPPAKDNTADDDRPLPEMSPRKKPRKQQLSGNQIQEPKFSEEEMEFIPSEKIKKTSKDGITHDGMKPAAAKRPVMSMMRTYRPTWKTKHNHFLRYSDVKPREEKRPSVADIAAQKNVLQRCNGWKVYHLAAQMTGISDLEMDVFDKLTAVLKAFEKKSGKDGDINRVNELIKGNIQRSKVITDQLAEAKCQVMKLFDHKCQVTEMLNRFSSRRSGKKRERV